MIRILKHQKFQQCCTEKRSLLAQQIVCGATTDDKGGVMTALICQTGLYGKTLHCDLFYAHCLRIVLLIIYGFVPFNLVDMAP